MDLFEGEKTPISLFCVLFNCFGLVVGLFVFKIFLVQKGKEYRILKITTENHFSIFLISRGSGFRENEAIHKDHDQLVCVANYTGCAHSAL